MRLVGPSLPSGIRTPSLFPGGNLGAFGSKPNREFFQAGSYMQGWGGGPREHSGKTRGVGEKGALKEGGRWGKEERGRQLGEVGKGPWGSRGTKEKPQLCSEDELRAWAGADRRLGPQPGGSSGQLAYRRSLALVSRFESSLRPWPPSAPTSPLASVPWQHLGLGGRAGTRASVCPAASPFGLCQTPQCIRGLQQVLFPLGH